MSNLRQNLVSVIFSGFFPQESLENYDSDDATERVVEFLSEASYSAPNETLVTIQDAVETKADGMVMVSLAIFTAQAPEEFLTYNQNAWAITSILALYGPDQLVEYVDYLRSKVFGRGFGSRPQKWVRRVMEGWHSDTLEEYIVLFPTELKTLIKLVHPRFTKVRGDLVKNFLKV